MKSEEKAKNANNPRAKCCQIDETDSRLDDGAKKSFFDALGDG